MKTFSPNLLNKSIGTQTERSVGTQMDTIVYLLENSTSAITVHKEIDFYEKPLWKTRSLPRKYLKPTPQNKSFRRQYFKNITRVLPEHELSKHGVMIQEKCISPVVGGGLKPIEKNNLITGGNNNDIEQENCMSLFVDDSFRPVDQNCPISANIEGNHSHSEQNNCTPSLVLDDKIKPVDQNDLISVNSGKKNDSCEQPNCNEDYVPIWKSNTTPRQYKKTRNLDLSKIVNAPGSSADNRVCLSSTSNGKPTSVVQNNSVSTIHTDDNNSREMENHVESFNRLSNKNARQYNRSLSKKGNVVGKREKSKKWMDVVVGYCEPMWKNNSTPRQYKSSRGTDLIKTVNSVTNQTKRFEKNNKSVNFSMKNNIERNTLKNGPSTPTSTHDLADTTAVQSIPALNLETSTVKTTVDVARSLNDSITTKNAQSPPDRSFNPGKGLSSMNQKGKVLGKVLMVSKKGDENVTTIDLRIFMPNKVGVKYRIGEELNETIAKPEVDFDKSNSHDGQVPNANVIEPKDSVKPKRVQIKPNADGNYVCGNCGKIYKKKRSLLGHMRRNRNTCKKSHPSVCVWCDTEFNTKGEFNLHEKTGCKPRPLSRKARGVKERVDKLCEYCGKEFSCSSSFYHHVQIHMNGERHMCMACGKRFIKIAQLRTHERCVHRKAKPWYYCTRCPHRSRLRKHIAEHEKIHDVPEGAEVPTPYKCDCGKGFISAHMLTVHKNSFHKPKKCNMCDEILGNQKLLSEHKLSAHNVSEVGKLNSDGTLTQTCPICAESFFGFCCKQKLDRHLDVEHNIAIGPGVRLSCNICYYTFRLFASYIHHKSTLHKVEVTESELRNMINCLSAGGETSSAESSRLISHRTRISKLNRVTRGDVGSIISHCPVCEKPFTDMNPFDYHLEVKHGIGNIGPDETLKCRFCARTFKSFAWYIYHTRSLHERTFNASELMGMTENLSWYKTGGIFQCEKCDKKYSARRKLKWHIRMKHPTELGFSCEPCDIHFETRAEFYKHKYSAVHVPTEKLSCNICDKKCNNTRLLWAHKIVHSTKSRIPCPDCGTKFKRKGDLMKHRRDKHKPDTDSN